MKCVFVVLTGMAVTLLALPVYAQSAPSGYVALAVNGGAGVVRMPTGQNGVLTSGGVNVTGGGDPLLIGPIAGLNAIASAGKLGELDAFVGANLFAMYATANSSRTQSFSGVGTVYIPGLSLPDNGSINLTTTRGATATGAGVVTATSPQGTAYSASPSASSGPADGAQTGASVSGNPADPSFIVAGANTAVSGGSGKSLAYGGIADTSGSLLIITGDLDGLSISTETSTTLIYGGGDITYGFTKPIDETASLQAYAGPSYRYIGQLNTTSVGADMTVNIPEVTGPTLHPLWIQDTVTNTTLASHYFGGVVGAGISKQVTEGVSIGLAGEASLYYLNANLHGTGSVTTTDGTPLQSPIITVPLDAVNVNTGTVAYAARAQASATFQTSQTSALTFAGSVDYLSAVARPYGGVVVTGANGNASWNSASGNAPISFGDMIALSGTVSFSAQF